MSKNYLLADTHFGHNDISKKFRTEFNSDEEHNETIHNNILSCAGKRNHLWLLGDIAFGQEQFRKLWEYSLEFQSVNVVLGNHDHKDLTEFCVQHGINVYGFVKKWGYWLSHCPIHPQELYRGKNIHGHVHTNTVGRYRDDDGTDWDSDPGYFNVSCENVGYKPISLQEIKERFGDE